MARVVRDDYKRVAKVLDGMVNTKEEYLRIRGVAPETLDLHHRAAHLIYLNKTCFRGLFRVNRHGRFNVPYGQYNRRYYDPENLRAVAAVFKNVEIRRGDFELTLADITAADFAYLDPPYFKLGGYSDFNRYTKTQFREHDVADAGTVPVPEPVAHVPGGLCIAVGQDAMFEVWRAGVRRPVGRQRTGGTVESLCGQGCGWAMSQQTLIFHLNLSP